MALSFISMWNSYEGVDIEVREKQSWLDGFRKGLTIDLWFDIPLLYKMHLVRRLKHLERKGLDPYILVKDSKDKNSKLLSVACQHFISIVMVNKIFHQR